MGGLNWYKFVGMNYNMLYTYALVVIDFLSLLQIERGSMYRSCFYEEYT